MYVCGCVLAYMHGALNCTRVFVYVYSVFLKILHSKAWCVSFPSEALKGKADSSKGIPQPGHMMSLSTYWKITNKSKISLCVSLPSCEIQEYPEWRDRYGGAPVSCLYRAGGELHTAKVIPASHFALHLVFIFQAIKPAARRWSVCVLTCPHKSGVCESAHALTNTWMWVCADVGLTPSKTHPSPKCLCLRVRMCAR